MTETKKPDGLKIALPNGSLEANTRKLFADAGLGIVGESRKHDARVNDPLISRVTFMRPQHIPKLVANQTYDLGICGSDCISEAGREIAVKIKTLANLPYGRGDSTGQTQVVLVSSRSTPPLTHLPVTKLREVPSHSRILSEYPNITKEVFQRLDIPVEIEFSYGGTEAHIPRDYEFGVCLTDTGASLAANNLRVIAALFQTNTVLIANCRSLFLGQTDRVIAVKNLLVGTLEARDKVFVIMNVSARKKSAVLQVLPALHKPTIAKLAGGNYFSVGTVVGLAEKNQVVAAALRAGAEGLIVQPISQIVERW